MFLSQMLDEYRESDEEDKDELFKIFIDRLWKSKYVFKKYKKYYRFKVNESLLGDRKDLIDLFNKYCNVEYVVCKSFYDKKIDYIDYIRVHINNTYGYLADKEVYFNSDYYKLLITPKKEYFRVIKAIKNGEKINCDDVWSKIENSLKNAEEVRIKSVNKKIELSFPSYKKLLNGYLRRIFDNYTPVHEYEDKHGWEMRVNVDGWSEDSYVVRYFNKSLTGYMRNYVNSSKPKTKKKKFCKICELELVGVSNRSLYCACCLKEVRNEQNKKKSLKYYYKNKHINFTS